MLVNFQSWWDILPEELKEYIHHLNFCQLKQDLKQDEKRQAILEELHHHFYCKELFKRLISSRRNRDPIWEHVK